MKRITVLFAELLCLTAMAQRDYQLVEDRNAWLLSNSSAALTTLKDSTIATGKVYFLHEGGKLMSVSKGRHRNMYGADVRSYCRLSEEVVTYGSMTYGNVHGTQMAGSMLFPTAELMPFDIYEVSDDNAGSKQSETFNIAGAIGWDAGRCFAVGAKVDFTAGNYAKHRDLRHSNTLMDLSAKMDFLYKPWNIGAGFLYRRRTETIEFKTYGTTDKVWQTLIDYANRFGETETFGGDGFTDDSREQPLFSEYIGAAAQWQWNCLFIDMKWQHRNGYYGKQSQYTASHSMHSGDRFDARLRCNLSEAERHLWWIDMTLNTEKLSAHRTNYRRVVSPENASLVYYEYYEPTKMSDKVQTSTAMSVTGYLKPEGDIYLWYLNGGLNLWTGKQTAYKYPESFTVKGHVLAPFVTLKRNLLFRNTSMLTAQAGYSMTFGSMEQLTAHARVAYEIPVKGTRIRPSLSAGYRYVSGTGGDMKGLSRHTLMVAAEATF
ncbi:MAG: hypothetical protein NC344_04640 [Bacteroidales bacterium]|nr:hypothetical protein [Bacteroidales bacterium]MCM1147113.1 hypothetical protein [Bacteroidales bacterium]MCM1205753.1 hypothetical protein [Bacillota bacterium]MCM1511144.1 hypothetical protein [Clostridium sp.]